MTTATDLPLLIAEVEVTAVHRLSPAFVRIEFGGEALADLGGDERSYDQRLKLVFPGAPGVVPRVDGADENWYAEWLGRPVDERGHMRTYTLRSAHRDGADTRIVVDFVLHLEPDSTGPGAAWAAQACPGDRIVVIGPRRGAPFGGIEWAPGQARTVVLAGDETAVPAICAILEQLPASARGWAYLEVPTAADSWEVTAPADVQVVWLPRGGSAHGTRLHRAVARHFGAVGELVESGADEVWETPTYSSSGERIVESRAPWDCYVWIAGESSVVTGLRRTLVREAGLDRNQVAFMGYWRRGVAMRS